MRLATEIGKLLANSGVGLITGGWPGVDDRIALSFAAVRSARGLAVDDALVSVAESAQQSVHTLGRLVVAETDDGYRQQTIGRADIVIVIGGGRYTANAGKLAATLGATVIPLPSVRVHSCLRGRGARPPGEPRVVPQRADRDRLRLLRPFRRPAGVEEGARRGVHVRLGLLAARGSGASVRRLQRGDRRAVPRDVPDRQGRQRDLVAREVKDEQRTEMVPESLDALHETV